MPTEPDIAAYRKALLQEEAELQAEDTATEEERGTVTLDQQSVGRLSRMDALQRQSMAQATQRRRSARSTRIKAALARMESGEFGYCLGCGEEISKPRLTLDPTVPNCVTCARSG